MTWHKLCVMPCPSAVTLRTMGQKDPSCTALDESTYASSMRRKIRGSSASTAFLYGRRLQLKAKFESSHRMYSFNR